MDQDQTIKDILETVQFLKENAATSTEVGEVRAEVGEVRAEVGEVRAEVHRLRQDFKEDLMVVKTEVITHVDGLAVLHQRLDTELAALRAKYDRLESHVLLLAKHTNLQLDF